MKLTFKEFLSWVGAIIATIFLASTFLFLTFQTKADANKYEEVHDKRLERMENKIDEIKELLK